MFSPKLAIRSSFIAAVLVSPCSLCSGDEWTDSTGERTVEATFVKLVGVNVTLRKADGKEVVLPLYKLDDKSRKRARQLAKIAEKGGNASPTDSLFPSAGDGSSPKSSIDPSLDFPEYDKQLQAAVERGEYEVIFDSLPPSFQNDIDEIYKIVISALDESAIASIKKVRNLAVDVLKTKKELFLNSSLLKNGFVGREMVEPLYDPVVKFIPAMLPDECLKLDKLQGVGAREMLTNYMKLVYQPSKELEAAVNGAFPMLSTNVMSGKEKTFKKIDDNTYESVVEGLPPTRFVRIEGRWLPEVLAQGWGTNVGMIKSELSKADIPRIVKAACVGAELALNSFASVDTQEDIDDILKSIIARIPSAPPMR